MALWSDEDAYLARAQAGRDFVVGHCSYEQLPKRLARLRESSTVRRRATGFQNFLELDWGRGGP